MHLESAPEVFPVRRVGRVLAERTEAHHVLAVLLGREDAQRERTGGAPRGEEPVGIIEQREGVPESPLGQLPELPHGEGFRVLSAGHGHSCEHSHPLAMVLVRRQVIVSLFSRSEGEEQ
jgi:hypothetical protein